ncbi:GGDEF domain-containing protein [Luteimonas kalidii]|uniref:diguanylate cyclase n=1 Tax=Luteimonas kalidii TaxID=3042025 RepID=A0ABT6JSS1_9GAMM|nr:GGDEF domain-containing protein [Luteimonas kalidii]MDH5833735.1 GGDEF domain-containing protein [Luteimonas kalidii]
MTPHRRHASIATCCLLFALALPSPPAAARSSDWTLHPDALRCYQLRQSDPAAAASLAGERLREGGLQPPDALVFEACQAASRALMGEADAARAGVERVEAVLAAHPMPTGYRLRALSNAGLTLQLAGDIPGALAAYERALRAAEEADAWEAQVTTLVNIALIHGEELAAYDEAEALLAQAARINAAHGAPKAIVAYNRGLNALRMEQPVEARGHFERAMAAARSADEGVVVDRVEAELAALDATPGTRQSLDRTYARQRDGGDASGAARTALLQAQLALAAGEPGRATADIGRAMAVLPASGFHAERDQALRLRAEALAASGDCAGALQASREAYEAQLARLRSSQLDGLARVQADLMDADNREALALARKEGELNSLRASHERRQRNLAIAALAILVMLALGFVAYQRRVTRRLRNLSTRDSLTRLLNRHAAGKRLGAMVPPRIDAGDARTVVFLIDIDHFKAINDRHGHGTGDAALVTVARALTDVCGPNAVVARWGGEEFLVGQRELDLAGACAVAERLRGAVATATAGGDAGTVAVSIGFAAVPVFPPRAGAASDAASGHWPDAVILADRALYAAKRSGRDTWVGLWGRAGARASIDDVLDDPGMAIAAGDVEVAAARPGFAWPETPSR